MPREIAYTSSDHQTLVAMTAPFEPSRQARILAVLLASIFDFRPALAESQVRAQQQDMQQDVTSDQDIDESNRDNDGEDITRPQNAVELRFLGRDFHKCNEPSQYGPNTLANQQQYPARHGLAHGPPDPDSRQRDNDNYL